MAQSKRSRKANAKKFASGIKFVETVKSNDDKTANSRSKLKTAGQILSSSAPLAQNLRTTKIIKRRLNQSRFGVKFNRPANLTNSKKGSEPLTIACKFSPNIKNA
ncbi:MAG: hypothetical protein ACFNUU_05155 [Campylobacter sp.]|uniref:hypothetical protein n=1 Tax=Campylobacter sp. TaxID=205 RepID=UPI00361B15D0